MDSRKYIKTLKILIVVALGIITSNNSDAQCVRWSPPQFVKTLVVTPPASGTTKGSKLAIRSNGIYTVIMTADDEGVALSNGQLIPIEIHDGTSVIASAYLEVGQDISTVQNDFNWSSDILPYLTNPSLVVDGTILLTGLSIGFEKANWAFATDNSYEHGFLSGSDWISPAKKLTWSSGGVSGTMNRVVDYIASFCRNANQTVTIQTPLHYDENGSTTQSDLFKHTSEYVLHQNTGVVTFTGSVNVTTFPSTTNVSWNTVQMGYDNFTENVGSGLDSVNIQFENGMSCINKSRGQNYIFAGLSRYEVSDESVAPNTLDLGSHSTRLSPGNTMIIDYNGVQTISVQGGSIGFETVTPVEPTGLVIGQRYNGFVSAGSTAKLEFQFELNYIF